MLGWTNLNLRVALRIEDQTTTQAKRRVFRVLRVLLECIAIVSAGLDN